MGKYGIILVKQFRNVHRVKGFAENVCEMQLKDKEQTRKKHAIRPSDSRNNVSPINWTVNSFTKVSI